MRTKVLITFLVALPLMVGAMVPAAAAQGGVPPPPVCTGPDRALQWDGAGWRCAIVGGGRCTEETLCARGRCTATLGVGNLIGILIGSWSDPACGGSDGMRCTYRLCRWEPDIEGRRVADEAPEGRRPGRRGESRAFPSASPP